MYYAAVNQRLRPVSSGNTCPVSQRPFRRFIPSSMASARRDLFCGDLFCRFELFESAGVVAYVDARRRLLIPDRNFWCR